MFKWTREVAVHLQTQLTGSASEKAVTKEMFQEVLGLWKAGTFTIFFKSLCLEKLQVTLRALPAQVNEVYLII